MTILYLTALAALTMASFIYVIYLLYGMWSAAPFVPTPWREVRRMLMMAQIQPGECLIDIGSGDGRLVFAAAAAGARGVGIEINPILYVWSVLKAKVKCQPRAKFLRKNLWQVNLAPADVLTIYCLPDKMERLRQKVKEEMRPGARVVVYAFPFSDWQYAEKDGKVYTYVV